MKSKVIARAIISKLPKRLIATASMLSFVAMLDFGATKLENPVADELMVADRGSVLSCIENKAVAAEIEITDEAMLQAAKQVLGIKALTPGNEPPTMAICVMKLV